MRAAWPLLFLTLACGVYQEGHSLDDARKRPAAWAVEISDQAAQHLVSQRLESVAAGAPDCGSYARPLVIGPALWGDIARAEPGLAKIGWHAVALVQASPAMGNLEWDMRSLRSASDVCAFLQSQRVRQFARELVARGRVRPATESEREFVYRISPLDLAGHPVVAIEHPQETFLAYLKDGGILWLEILTGWRQSPALLVLTQPAQIPDSVDVQAGFRGASPAFLSPSSVRPGR